ncbi:thyrotropin-releasing hormone-degrading ectoenzyme-like isoform X2 [Ceratina calcarata]|nr:thyrotropin-releasing hormone-degrading ectoenzyme-like isoform X2 [Ceratina calcarata]
MPQFSGGPVEFMTSDDIELKRGDGWFLSYTKIAGIVVVFIIGVVAAGFLGWYINSLPKKEEFDSVDLSDDEIEGAVDETLASPFVIPLKYRLELIPIIDVTGSSRLKGRVVIDFRVNDTTGLDRITLNAGNVTVTNYKLSNLETPMKKRRSIIVYVSSGSSEFNDFSGGRVLRSVNDNSTEDSIQEDAETENASEATTLAEADNQTTATETTITTTEQPITVTTTLKPTTVQTTTQTIVETGSLPTDDDSSRIPIASYDVDEDKKILTIRLDSQIQQGVYELDLEYETAMDEGEFFIANYTEDMWLMGTRLRHSGAKYLFPVFDDTVHKSVFSVSVARSKETRVLTNMPSSTLRDTTDGSVLETFNDSVPLSTNELAFLMGHVKPMNETVIGNTDAVATFWCESNRDLHDSYLLDKLGSIVINLIDVFSLAYPLPKVDIVCLPPGIDENMASPGLIAIKQSLFNTADKSSLVVKSRALKDLINLMGQQWFSELVNVNRSEEWILGGSLIHFQHRIVPEIDPSSNLADSFLVDVQQYVMEIDGYTVSRPLRENVNNHLLESLNDEYAKGACLIRMLHGAISDTAFRNGYKKLINRWRYNATDLADFMNILKEETELPDKISLEEAMNSWISQGGHPLVTVMRNYEERSITVYQEQFSLDKPSESTSKFWQIPLNYINSTGNWSSPTTLWFPAEPRITFYHVDPNDSWILFNVNKTGYYRVHYDEKNWMLLKAALAENHELFPVETRASLIDDVFSLAAMGVMKYEAAFAFIKYMQMRERHYQPWAALTRHMLKLSRLLYETSVFNDFQEYIVKFVSPLYNETGYKLEEGSELTMVAIELACVFEHAECLDWAKNIFQNSTDDEEIEKSVPSYVRETFYCTIARYGTRKEWNYFTEKIRSTEDEEERKRLLSSAACFQAPWVLQSILSEILQGRFKEDEIPVILKSFPRNPAAAQVASRFVRANWPEIAQRFAGSYPILKSFVLSMVNGLTTEQDMEDLLIFRENNYDSMKGTRYAAALVEANGNFVTTWLKNSLAQIENILKVKA